MTLLPLLDRLLVVQTVFERVDGPGTERDSFWHLESVDCVGYTDPSLGTYPTTTREGLKLANKLDTE